MIDDYMICMVLFRMFSGHPISELHILLRVVRNLQPILGHKAEDTMNGGWGVWETGGNPRSTWTTCILCVCRVVTGSDPQPERCKANVLITRSLYACSGSFSDI